MEAEGQVASRCCTVTFAPPDGVSLAAATRTTRRRWGATLEPAAVSAPSDGPDPGGKAAQASWLASLDLQLSTGEDAADFVFCLRDMAGRQADPRHARPAPPPPTRWQHKVYELMYNKVTDNFIFACIFASVVVMAVGGPLLGDGELKDNLTAVEWFCTMPVNILQRTFLD